MKVLSVNMVLALGCDARVVWCKCTDALRQLRSWRYGSSRILCKSQLTVRAVRHVRECDWQGRKVSIVITYTLEPGGPQHDRSAACVIAQQYSSRRLFAFLFPRGKNLALFKNSIITSAFFFLFCFVLFSNNFLPVPVAARSKDVGLWPLACWDCGFESHRGHGCLSWVLCVVRKRSVRRSDHSSSGILPTVVRRCVWSRKLVNEEATVHWGLSRQKQTNNFLSLKFWECLYRSYCLHHPPDRARCLLPRTVQRFRPAPDRYVHPRTAIC